MGRLIVCCPHCRTRDEHELVIESGALLLVTNIPIVKRFGLEYAHAQERALIDLRRWAVSPARDGERSVELIAHPECVCKFIRPLDIKTTEECLNELAQELREELYGQPRVSTRVVSPL